MRLRIKSILLLLTCISAPIIVLWWCLDHGLLRFNYPSRSKYPVHGIDISHHQGKIDWDELARQDIQFIYMKATEGGDWVDPQFNHFWTAAMEREMTIGAYHFYRLCKTGIEQADNFIATVPADMKAMPHAVDLEHTGRCEPEKSRETIVREIHDYITKVSDHYGKPPIIYATRDFYDLYLRHQLMDTRIWFRNIYWQPKLPDDRRWSIWQYSNRGRIKGIERYVDLNVFRGNALQFEAFASADN